MGSRDKKILASKASFQVSEASIMVFGAGIRALEARVQGSKVLNRGLKGPK